jgi:hypothetical protein
LNPQPISKNGADEAQFLTFVLILATSSPDNNDYFLKLLQHFNPEANSPIGRLLGELGCEQQPPSPSNEMRLNDWVSPLHLSPSSSVNEPPVLRLNIWDDDGGGEGSPRTPNQDKSCPGTDLPRK